MKRPENWSLLVNRQNKVHNLYVSFHHREKRESQKLQQLIATHVQISPKYSGASKYGLSMSRAIYVFVCLASVFACKHFMGVEGENAMQPK